MSFALVAPPVVGAPAASLLNALPKAVNGALTPLFTGNAIAQAGLNGQRKGTPSSVFAQVKQALIAAGYSEQPIRTTIGAWGFSATWAPPSGVTVDGTAAGKTAVLVTQGTALGPELVNLNVRFEGI